MEVSLGNRFSQLKASLNLRLLQTVSEKAYLSYSVLKGDFYLKPAVIPILETGPKYLRERSKGNTWGVTLSPQDSLIYVHFCFFLYRVTRRMVPVPICSARWTNTGKSIIGNLSQVNLYSSIWQNTNLPQGAVKSVRPECSQFQLAKYGSFVSDHKSFKIWST